MTLPRRDFLVRALSLGWLAGGTGWHLAALAAGMPAPPPRLPAGKSIFRLEGDVRVNGRPADAGTRIAATDKIVTGANSYVVAAVGDTAFLLRQNSTLELGGVRRLLVQSMRLVSGAVMSVFGTRRPDEAVRFSTPSATIGIRGTGIYAESGPRRTYFCTCYGTTEVAPAGAEDAAELVTSRHHDAPRWIPAAAGAEGMMERAPMHGHNDVELVMLEALVGRDVPFEPSVMESGVMESG